MVDVQIVELSEAQVARWKQFLDERRAAAGFGKDTQVVQRMLRHLTASGRVADDRVAQTEKTLQKELSQFRNAVPSGVHAWFGDAHRLGDILATYADALETTADVLRRTYRAIATGAPPEAVHDPWHVAFPEVVRGQVFVDPPARSEGDLWSSRGQEPWVAFLEKKVRTKLAPQSKGPVVVWLWGSVGSGRHTLAWALKTALQRESEAKADLLPPASQGPLTVRLVSEAESEVTSDADVVIVLAQCGPTNGSPAVTVHLEPWDATTMRAAAEHLVRAGQCNAEHEQGLRRFIATLESDADPGLPALAAHHAITLLGRLAELPTLAAGPIRDALIDTWVPSARIADALGRVWFDGVRAEPLRAEWTLPSTWPGDVPTAPKAGEIEELASKLQSAATRRAERSELKDYAERLGDLVRVGDYALLVGRAVELGALRRHTGGYEPVDPLLPVLLVAREAARRRKLPFGEDAWWARADADVIARELAIAGFKPHAFFAELENDTGLPWLDRAVLEVSFAAHATCIDEISEAVVASWATVVRSVADCFQTFARHQRQAGGHVSLLADGVWTDPFAGLPAGVAERVLYAMCRLARVHAATLPPLPDSGVAQVVTDLSRGRLRPQAGQRTLCSLHVRLRDEPLSSPPDWVWACGLRFPVLENPEDWVLSALCTLSPLPALGAITGSNLLAWAAGKNPWLWDWLEGLAVAGDVHVQRMLSGQEDSDDERTRLDPPWAVRIKWWRFERAKYPEHEHLLLLSRQPKDDPVAERALREHLASLTASRRRRTLMDLSRLFDHLAIATKPLGQVLALGDQLDCLVIHERLLELARVLLDGLSIRPVNGFPTLEGPPGESWSTLERLVVGGSLESDPRSGASALLAVTTAGPLAILGRAVEVAVQLARGGRGPSALRSMRELLDQFRASEIPISCQPLVGYTPYALGTADEDPSGEYAARLFGTRAGVPPFRPTDDNEETAEWIEELRYQLSRAIQSLRDDAVDHLLWLDDVAFVDAASSTEFGRMPTLLREDRWRQRLLGTARAPHQAWLDFAFHFAASDGVSGSGLRPWIARASLDGLASFAWWRSEHPDRVHVVDRLARECLDAAAKGWRLLAMSLAPESEAHDVWLREQLDDMTAPLDVAWVRAPERDGSLAFPPVRWEVDGVGTHIAALTLLLARRPTEAESRLQLEKLALRWFRELLARCNRLDAGGTAGSRSEDQAEPPDTEFGELCNYAHLGAPGLERTGGAPRRLLLLLTDVLADGSASDEVWTAFALPPGPSAAEPALAGERALYCYRWAQSLDETALRQARKVAVQEGDDDVLWALLRVAQERGLTAFALSIARGYLDRIDPSSSAEILDEDALGWLLVELELSPEDALKRLQEWGAGGPEHRTRLCQWMRPWQSHGTSTTRASTRAVYRRWLMEE